jgi:hypothetical protein
MFLLLLRSCNGFQATLKQDMVILGHSARSLLTRSKSSVVDFRRLQYLLDMQVSSLYKQVFKLKFVM